MLGGAGVNAVIQSVTRGSSCTLYLFYSLASQPDTTVGEGTAVNEAEEGRARCYPGWRF